MPTSSSIPLLAGENSSTKHPGIIAKLTGHYPHGLSRQSMGPFPDYLPRWLKQKVAHLCGNQSSQYLRAAQVDG